jgi:hypothetical protein
MIHTTRRVLFKVSGWQCIQIFKISTASTENQSQQQHTTSSFIPRERSIKDSFQLSSEKELMCTKQDSLVCERSAACGCACECDIWQGKRRGATRGRRKVPEEGHEKAGAVTRQMCKEIKVPLDPRNHLLHLAYLHQARLADYPQMKEWKEHMSHHWAFWPDIQLYPNLEASSAEQHSWIVRTHGPEYKYP